MSRDQLIRLRDMLAAAERAVSYARVMTSADDLARDRQAFDAILYNLFVMGEATKGVPPAIRDRYPDIEWRSMAALRDVLAHEYFGIEDDIIWDVVTAKLPPLIPKLRATIESEGAGGEGPVKDQ